MKRRRNEEKKCRHILNVLRREKEAFTSLVCCYVFLDEKMVSFPFYKIQVSIYVFNDNNRPKVQQKGRRRTDNARGPLPLEQPPCFDPDGQGRERGEREENQDEVEASEAILNARRVDLWRG